MDQAPDWDVKLLYDGDCPLCTREVRFMDRLNRRGRLALQDIGAMDFDAAHYGLTREQVMGHIHAVLPDGTVVTGMEAFRRSYGALGLGALLAPTGWPGLKRVFDAGYDWFARNRLRLTGRGACETGTCSVNPAPAPRVAPIGD